MADAGEALLNHFAFFRFKDRYWDLPAGQREIFHEQWLQDLRSVATNVMLYQVFPVETGSDFLVWCAAPGEGNGDADAFFRRFAEATNPHRHLIEAVTILWGFTRPSQYSKARSKQEIDALAGERKQYLIVYPFVKTVDWYLTGQETRQGMMNEHIRIGKQYEDIKQLLLYSFGLQNQEFVVVYETDDLVLFSGLVKDLRETEGRRFTERDAPLHTAIYRPLEEGLALWR